MSGPALSGTHSIVSKREFWNSSKTNNYDTLHHSQQAYSLMEEMRARIPTVNMAYYINIRTIETIHQALDIPLGRGMGAEGGGGDTGIDDDDEVEEDVQEEDEGYC